MRYHVLSSNPKLPQHDIGDIGIGQRLLDEDAAFAGQEHAALIFTAGWGAVRTSHQGGIERDAFVYGVPKHLDGVVARLAVDVDGAGEFGCLRVVEPPVIRLPTVGRRNQHHVTGQRVFQLVLVELIVGHHLGDARLILKQLAHLRNDGRVGIATKTCEN